MAGSMQYVCLFESSSPFKCVADCICQDPHLGNLLIRPSPQQSKSPYNFEVVLLDHGLYFDIDPSLRINYSNLWLSLIAPASPEVNADRRKYAELVGNIGPDLVGISRCSAYLLPNIRFSTLSLKLRLQVRIMSLNQMPPGIDVWRQAERDLKEHGMKTK